jgi:DeoR/GlpR family transcriptional regulator of sugar metabolism
VSRSGRSEEVKASVMLALERQNAILQRVREHGTVRVSALTAEFGVSDMTVRRDLDQLARQGLLDKVHGGARLSTNLGRHEPGFEAKSTRQEAEKREIAMNAARLVRPGLTVGLSAGTTTRALAVRLTGVEDLTIVTNSVRVAEVFHGCPRPDRTVLLTGGERTPSDALVGQLAVTSLAALNLDLMFLGVHGYDERAGFTSPNLLEAETNRAFVKSAQHLVVLADHTKWGVVGVATIAPLERAETIVIDSRTTDEAKSVLDTYISAVHIAEPSSAPA